MIINVDLMSFALACYRWMLDEWESVMPALLTKRDLETLNLHLEELAAIEKDLAKAKDAGVPNIDPIIERCGQCKDRCIQLKKTYFPNES